MVAAAPGLDAQVPTCPGWTLFDLVKHLGGGDRFWAAIVGAGPADAPPAEAVAARAALEVPQEREALLAWLDASTQLLLGALRAAGPESGCWTWWPASQSPQTAGGTARHRVQETAVHTYDAQLAAGAPQPLPAELALDGVEEFLFTVWQRPAPGRTSPRPSTSTPPRAAPGASPSTATAHASPASPRPPPRPAKTRTQPAPPSTARPVSWSSTCTTVSPPTPCTLTETQGCSTCSAPGSRRRSRTSGGGLKPARRPRGVTKPTVYLVRARTNDLRTIRDEYIDSRATADRLALRIQRAGGSASRPTPTPGRAPGPRNPQMIICQVAHRQLFSSPTRSAATSALAIGVPTACSSGGNPSEHVWPAPERRVGKFEEPH